MNQIKPIAAGIASLGRGNDKMLVHMTPGEVRGLQAIAMAHGGSLTINPETGLPEAGFLSSILPMIAGAVLTPIMGPAAPFVIGAATGAMTGNLGKGIMAGLGAYGGGQLGSALGAMGAEATGATQAAYNTLQGSPVAAPLGAGTPTFDLSVDPNLSSAVQLGGSPPPPPGVGADYNLLSGATPAAADIAPTYGEPAGAPSLALATGPAEPSITGGLGRLVSPGGPTELMQRMSGTYGQPAGGDKKDDKKGSGNTMLLAAALGLPLLAAMQKKQTAPVAPTAPTSYYQTAYSPGRVNPRFGLPGEPYYIGQGFSQGVRSPSPGFAAGGEIGMADGGIPRSPLLQTLRVPPPTAMNAYFSNLQQDLKSGLPAIAPNVVAQQNDSLSPLGGFTYDPLTHTYGMATPAVDDATLTITDRFDDREDRGDRAGGPITGMAAGGLGSLATAAGGKLLQGHGDGMSDSIPAVIQGSRPQRAALADGEFVMPADVVSHIGNGSTRAGAKRLYAMMDRVRKARTGSKRQAPEVNMARMMPA